jgi:hypothetical protein
MPMLTQNQPIKIRTISNVNEAEYYGDILARQHYLKSSQINRGTVVHVARRGREDVAILTWESNCRRWFGMRDRLIGWTKDQRQARGKYCVENRRFLMLVQEPNLASQVLSLSQEELCRQSMRTHGHEFLLAETFVDPSRGYHGTCYKAAGWQEIGLTQGGRGPQQRSKKLYFVKTLKADALAKLKAPELAPSDTHNPRQKILSLARLDLPGLKRRLDAVPDPRKHQGWYPLSAVYALIVAAVLCGETNVKGIQRWVKELSIEVLHGLGCRKAPSYSMFNTTLRRTNEAAFSTALLGWLEEQVPKVYPNRKLRILSFDGKNLRAASNASGTERYVLSLLDTIAGVVIAQKPVNEKTNEIPVAPEMLNEAKLDAQTVVVADALHTQRQTANTALKKTLTTYSRLKTTNARLRKPSLKKLNPNNGRYRAILRSLRMDG